MTAYSGPLEGEPIDRRYADALVSAFPGIWPVAARLAGRSGEWFDGDPDAGLVSPTAMKRAAKAAVRFAGVRDILVEDHPVVIGLLARLAADRAHIPAPDTDIVERLAGLPGFAFDGTVVTVDGVPLPAGRRQSDYFMVQRYRPLYDPRALPHLVYSRDPDAIANEDRAALGIADGERPDLIHLLAYDAANVTEETQETLLTYSTAIHRDTLVALQRDRPALYVAIWRRDMATAKRLMRVCRQPPLPPSNPNCQRSRAKQLLHGTALLGEFERLFEIIDAVSARHGVTRQSLKAALQSCSSMSAVRAVGDPTHRFLAGSVAHTRSLHPTMNARPENRRTGDPILERARTAFDNARGYRERTRRLGWIAGAMPAQYFLGVEPAMLAPVALIQMIWNMARHEPNFWLHGERGHAANARDERRALVVELAVVITGNICPATARSMLPPDAADKALAIIGTPRGDENWRDAVLPTLIANPGLAAQIEERAHRREIEWPEPANADGDRRRYSSAYDRGMTRAHGLAALDRPGWTQGFLFDAWLRPHAELAFLRNCCRYVQYDPAQAAKRDAWDAAFSTKRKKDGHPVTAIDIATGLPRAHPLEGIQNLFRAPFDRMQVADLVGERATIKERAWRDAAIAEIAPLLAAVSPITLDPQLAERRWRDLDEDMVRIATEGAWNT